MLKEYFRHRKNIQYPRRDYDRKDYLPEDKKALKERVNDYLSLGGWNFVKDITYHILMSPFYFIFILFSPFLLLYAVFLAISGIIFYIPVSLIIGGIIDLFRNLFFKKGVRFKKWKYTIQILSWWEFLPYDMTYDGYLDFKEGQIHMAKAERIFEDYWDSKIDRKRAEQAFRNIPLYQSEEDIRNTLDCVDDYKRFHVSKVGVSSSHIVKRAKREAFGTWGRIK